MIARTIHNPDAPIDDGWYGIVVEEAKPVEWFSKVMLDAADPRLLTYAMELDGETYITIRATNGTWRYREMDSLWNQVKGELVRFTVPE